MRSLILLTLFCVFAFAEIKTYTKTVRETFSGSQSADDARLYAIKKVEADIAKEVGEYISTLTLLQDGKIVGEGITAISAAIMKTEVKNERRFMDGNNFAIELTIASTLDTDTINEQIANILKSQENIKAINSLQKQNEALLKRLAELEKQNANAKTDEQKELVRQEYAAAKDQAETMSDLEKTLSFTIERLNEVDRDRAMEYYERGEEAYKIAEPYTRRYIFTYDDMNEHKRGMNQFNTAIAQYTKALKIDPNMLEAYWRRGFSYYHLDDYKNAIADFDRLVALKPTVKHYEIRAQAHAHFGKYDDALKDYAKALALDPYDRSVYEERAIRVYFAAKEYKTAMQDLFKICELGDCGLITYIFYRAKSSLLSNPDYTHFILNNIVANEDFIRESREYIREITKEARKACESGDCNRLKLLREIGVLLD